MDSHNPGSSNSAGWVLKNRCGSAYLRSAARNVILRHVRNTTLSRLHGALGESGAPGLPGPLQQCLEAATPNLVEAGGGATRLLVVTPADSDVVRLQEEIKRVAEDEATMVRAPGGETLLCYEVEQVSLEGVAARFTRSRPDCQELALRLHTRADIQW